MGRRSRKRGVLSDPIDGPAAPPRAARAARPSAAASPTPGAARPGRGAPAAVAPGPARPSCASCVGMIAPRRPPSSAADRRGAAASGFGLVLVVAATGELALREHLAGYRSHSALLAGLAAIVVAAPLAALVQPPQGGRPGASAAVVFVARAPAAARALPPPLRRRQLAGLTARSCWIRAVTDLRRATARSRARAGAAHAPDRPAPRHADLRRPRAHDGLLPRPARPGARARGASTTTTPTRATSGSATDPAARRARCISFLEYPQMRAGDPGARARPTTSRWRVGSARRARRVARLPALARRADAPTCSTAAACARSTCATPTGTSSRSRRRRPDRPAGASGAAARAPPQAAATASAGTRSRALGAGLRPSRPASRRARGAGDRSSSRSVLLSDIGIVCRNFRQRV